MRPPRAARRSDCRRRRSRADTSGAGAANRDSRSSLAVSYDLRLRATYDKTGQYKFSRRSIGLGVIRMRDEADRYAPARRLNEVRAMLNSATGVTVYDIAD